MTDLVVSLPISGEAPWGAKLNSAVQQILDRVNQNTTALASGTGGTVADGAITSAKILDGTIVDADISNVAAIAQSKIANLGTALAALAPLTSPALSGTPIAPTALSGTNSTQLATTAFVKAAIDSLIAGAPGALDTLNEIAAQLATDENAVTALTTTVAGKVPATRTVAGRALTADIVLSQSDIAGLVAALALLSPLASPTFTGVPVVPSPTIAGSPTTKSYVDTAVGALPNIGVLLSTDPDPTTPGFWFREV